MIYQWVLPKTVNDEDALKIEKEFNIHPVIARILYNRQIDTKSKIDKYFNYDLNNLYDPFLLDGMDKAVERIVTAMREGENIVIYGDYDVDGVTSVSILYDCLFNLGGKVSFFIPDRFKEGYGLSEQGIKIAKKRKTSLIITVDCGVSAINEVDFANEQGIDVIICDHHETGDKIPNAVAVVNPKIKNSNYPFRELAGCGVAFKLLQALTAELNFPKDYVYKYLDLVAMGTAADIVQLTDENRIFVKNGLDLINKSPRCGIFALLENCGALGQELTVNAIVFMLAPRINSVGRMSNAKKAVHLLTTKSLQQARNIARILEKENEKRKSIDEGTFEEAKEIVKKNVDINSKRILVLSKENWHAGVIGIVASRMMEKFNRPSILISIQKGVGKGSARSTHNFDMYSALKKLEYLMVNFGGHRYAAGITILEKNIAKLDEEINKLSADEFKIEEMIPKLVIDSKIELNQFNANFLNNLKALAPFGPNNMRPVFVTYDLQIYGKVSIVGNNHLKMKFKQNEVVIDAIGYNLGEYVDELKKPYQQLNCAYVLEETKWSGQKTIQMRIKDFEVN
jgi:single-stranded-DNA-specific exonuclease